MSVSGFGQRYGPQRAPATQFDLALCDAEPKAIAQWNRNYSEFPWGAEKWVQIKPTPTRVPRQFSICVDFRPTARNGVYVAFDSSTRGHSVVGTPGKPGEPLVAGDWMIRVERDRKADTAALGAGLG